MLLSQEHISQKFCQINIINIKLTEAVNFSDNKIKFMHYKYNGLYNMKQATFF